MHKLLTRQLRRFSLDKEMSPEWQELLNMVNEAYTEYDQSIKSMHLRLDISSRELLERNAEISETLEILKQTQTNLIQSEKMAGLGKLIAGISHEINTPAGAITNAIKEIKKDYFMLLSELLYIVDKLPADLRKEYLDACIKVITLQHDLSTVEIREIAKGIHEKLTQQGISSHRMMEKNLAMAGFTQEDIKLLYHLLKTKDADLIHQSLFKLSMSQIHVRDIQIAISRIVNLVKALKLYSHDNPDQLVSTDLRQDIKNTLIILNSRLKRAIKVHNEFDEVPAIQCYADQLNQVWTNLINNAIEAMHGEGSIWIKVFQSSPDSLTAQIEDNGPGIPPEVLPSIFDPYFTTKPKGEGTGLGLSISKEIIAKHKGSIDVESRPGKTVFTVTLPLIKGEANDKK